MVAFCRLSEDDDWVQLPGDADADADAGVVIVIVDDELSQQGVDVHCGHCASQGGVVDPPLRLRPDGHAH